MEGQLAKITRKPNRNRQAVIVTKVIRQDGKYICGICRQHHDTKEAGLNCLKRCHASYLASQGVTQDTGKSKKFRCAVCKRVYSERPEAVKCLNECRESRQQSGEKQINMSRELNKANALRGIGSDEKKLAKAAEIKKHQKPQSDEQSTTEVQNKNGSLKTNDHLSKPVSSQNPSPSHITSLGADNPTKGNTPKENNKSGYSKNIDRSNMHKFTRDGRTLICKKCGKEFTNMEKVVACFDGHPEQEKGRKATDEDKRKFAKNGADFECKFCAAGYPAWMDAVNCYDSHETSSEKEFSGQKCRRRSKISARWCQVHLCCMS